LSLGSDGFGFGVLNSPAHFSTNDDLILKPATHFLMAARFAFTVRINIPGYFKTVSRRRQARLAQRLSVGAHWFCYPRSLVALLRRSRR